MLVLAFQLKRYINQVLAVKEVYMMITINMAKISKGMIAAWQIRENRVKGW